MFKRTQLLSSILLAFGGTVGPFAGVALAQDATQRVEVTGSAIRRIDAESSLPVQVLRREDIERTGATSTVDLLRRLPAVQGSTGESASVGGSTYGFSGVSIHNVGETRTLVLLNGHRLAIFGGQTLTGFAAGMDLNALPVSAIERVEILTDGASALYGADAIAGVVNFITKRDTTAGEATIGFSRPDGGAREKRASVTKGFGNLADDGFNVIFTLAHDERTALKSTDRSFASTGRVQFSKGGKNYRFQQYSASTIPGNISNDAGALINPYLIANGQCAPQSFRVTDGADDFCGFDFVSTLEIYPVRDRDSAFISGTKQLGNHQLYADVLWSRTKQTSRIAPVPGGISIPKGSALHDQYALPLGIQEDTIAFYRLFDLGARASKDEVNFYDIALGSKGTVGRWDYDATYTRSQSRAKSNISGYPGALALAGLRASGLLDPFVLPGQQSPEAAEAIRAVNFNGYWDGGKSQLDTVSIRGSTPLMDLAGGSMALALGANFNKEKFTNLPSLFAQGRLADPVNNVLCDVNDPALPCDQRFGDAAAKVPYSASRRSWGVFGELVMPVAKQLELSAAVRYDKFSDFGNATTAKAAFRWNPTPQILVRGSVGSGFHAPTVPQVKASPESYGVTTDKYDCTTSLQEQATAQGGECRPGSQQYDVVAGGNPNLKPEKSRQATLGVVLEPIRELSIGADYWFVGIRDSFGQLTEQTVFANPGQFPGAWTSQVDVGTGKRYLALNLGNLNLGKEYYSGIDFNVVHRAKTGFGDLNTAFTATYMLREQKQLEPTGPFYSAINNNAELGTVTFRWQGRIQSTLRAGAWDHTLGMNFKSGYKDQATEVEVLDDSGAVIDTETIRLKVKKYYSFDWQSTWAFRKDMSLTLGLLNIFDRDPPFTLSTAGTNKGQQFGFDDRYYDPRGRTLYGNFTYRF
ncbi:MAG: TonB-dependent receptor domain-containing protein [Aquincola tertiaricarbonis]